MDVWFDSGSSWAAVLAKRDGLNFPAYIYLEGSDQHCALGDPLHYQITEIDRKVSMAQIRRVSGFIEKRQNWTLDCKVEQSWNHKMT